MPRALRLLMWLQLRGVLRRLVRRTKSVRGAIFFLLGLILIGAWFAQAIVGMVFLRRAPASAEQFLTWGPLGLLGLVLVVLASGSESSLAFRPAEIDFLFPAPFSRRQLLIYKLAGRFLGAVFSTLLFSLWIGRYGHSAWFVLPGCWLALVFVQLLPIAIALAAQSVAEAAYSWVRRAFLLLVVAAIVLGAWMSAPADLNGSWAEIVERLRHSPPVEMLLAPFTVFVKAILAPRLFPDFLQWAGLGLLINGLLVGGVLWLDANYFEAAMAASRRVQSRLSAMRRGGGTAMGRAVEGASRRRVPMFPRWAGAGTIAWRQATTLVRTSWWLWIILALGFTAPSVMPMLAAGKKGPTTALVLGGGSAGLAYLTIMLTWTVRFDFRAEMTRMDWLKMLPLRPLALVVGELLVPCLATAAVQLIIWTTLCLFAGEPMWIFAGVALALPVCAFLYGIENLLFLLFPPQTMLTQVLDLQTFGRQFVLAMVKALTWLVVTLVVGLPSLAVGWLCGESIAAGIVTACLLLVAVDAGLLAAIAWAFQRFDVSRDVPGQ